MRDSCELPSTFPLNVSPIIEMRLRLAIYESPFDRPNVKLVDICCPCCDQVELRAIACLRPESVMVPPGIPKWDLVIRCGHCLRRRRTGTTLTTPGAGQRDLPRAPV